MESLTRLRRKRGTLRAMATRTVNAIEGQLAEEDADETIVAQMVRQLETIYARVEECDKEIEVLIVDEEEFDAEITGVIEVLEKVTSTKFRFEKRFPAAIVISSTSGSPRGAEAADNESVVSVNDTEMEVVEPLRNLRVNEATKAEGANGRGILAVKLPKLEIQRFGGDACKWQTFWSQYDAAIHSNPQLSRTQKMVYLNSILVDDALSSITGLEISCANYDAAIEILKQRFGRRDIVINAHMKKLLALHMVRSSTDVKGLRKLFDICEVEIRSLESLGVSPTMFSSLLCPVLMNAMPEDIAYDFQMRRSSTEDVTVSELLAFLRNVIEAKERASSMTGTRRDKYVNESDLRQEDRKREHRRQASASTLQTSYDKRKCIFCSSEHSSFKCKKDAKMKHEILRESRRCFVCFGKGHTSTECRNKENCSNCNRRHNRTICFSRERANGVNEKKEEEAKVEETIATTTNSVGNAILLQTASAKLSSKGEPTVRILLDGGSETSFILEDLSKEHRLPIVSENRVNVYTFGNTKPTSTVRKTVQVKLRSFVNGQEITLNANESKIISSAIVLTPNQELRKEMEKRQLPMAEVIRKRGGDSVKISILIGSDYYWKVATGRMERLTPTLVAVETIFGWCLQGVTQLCNFVSSSAALHSSIDDKLSTQVKAFWDLESLGIVNDNKTESIEEKQVLEQFEQSVCFVNGRYTVQLPWNDRKANLDSNYGVALKRLRYLSSRFERNEELFRRYKSVIEEQLENGIAEAVKEDDVNAPVFYIPHQAVIRDDKATTKLRVVFDASSHERGKPSLNDCLHCGPNLVPDLANVILKFRQKKYAFMADIQKAFLQISVDEGDRNALRFLWFKEHWTPGEDLIVNEYRMSRVLFGATCSPFLLAATIKYHIGKFKDNWPHVVEKLDRQLYVDDFIGSEATEEELKEVRDTSTFILDKAGMPLTKWSTNSKVLANKWNATSETVPTLPLATDLNSEKVLGIVWDNREDVFAFNVNNILEFVNGKEFTKRNILKTLSRIFDPLGFASPFSVRVKVLFQRLWEKGLEWDVIMDENDVNEWKAWLSELSVLQHLKIKRCLEEENPVNVEIHLFSDASEVAYGAVAYVCVTLVNGVKQTNIIMSKSRVAPLKKLSLPRLELMGAVIAARLKAYLEKMFINAKFHLWTDAMIVLHWIRGSAKRWKPFVANRVSEIHSLTNPDSWNHCSGKTNPADALTRGLHINDLIENDLWWKGPNWLTLDPTEWPKAKLESLNVDVSNELRSVFASNVISETASGVVNENEYSTLTRLLRVTAWIQRFGRSLKTKKKQLGPLSVNEIDDAEKYWIKYSQEAVYATEISCCREGKPAPKASKLDLCVFVDEYGLLRSKGRLQFSDLNEDAKHPIVLPRDSHLAALVIFDAHQRVKHLGVQATLAEIRSKYLIPRGRQLIKSILRRCVTCRKLNAKSFNEQFAPLPADRSSSSTPFEVIGIDFAGPIITRTGKKVYILLVTCASTRAVHFELVPEMSTETTIMAFKRFISRRGIPSTIYSDNGKTFKRMNIEIKALFENITSTKVQDMFTKLRIKWKFIVERSPWWGGFWERMVRTVKSTLKKILGNASLKFEEIATILIECEAVINDRPLTYTYNDANEMQPLTPSMLMIGRRISSLPSTAKNVNVGSDRSALITRWEYRQRIIDHFWKRWQKEYLLQLSWPSNQLNKESLTKPKVGDVVLVREDNLVRQLWLLAKIVETIPGRDNRIRACKVKTSKGSVLSRPIQRLYPLEVSSTEVDGTSAVSMAGECCGTSTNEHEASRSFSNIRNGNDALSRNP